MLRPLAVLCLAAGAASSWSASSLPCEPLDGYEAPQQALLARQRWSLNLTFELEAFLNAHAPRGKRLGKEPETYTPHKLGHRRFDLVGPVGPRCAALETYGVEDGEKRACALSARAADAGCIVISVGSHDDWDFEAAVFEKTKCTVHTFDCTVGAEASPPNRIRARVSLHRLCVGARDEVLDGRAFASWQTLLHSINLTRAPTFMKLDVEGYEWEVLPELIKHRHAPLQVAFELHYHTQMRGLSWYLRYKSEAEIGIFIDTLYRHGYYVVDRHDNKHCSHCTELLISRLCKGSARAHVLA